MIGLLSIVISSKKLVRSNNNKIVFTRSDSNTIDPSLLNIQRLVVKLSTATQAYTLGTSFAMPSDNRF